MMIFTQTRHHSSIFISITFLVVVGLVSCALLTFIKLSPDHSESNGFFSLGSAAAIRTRRKLANVSSYSDTFPNRSEMIEMIQLSRDIFGINGKYVDSREVSDPKWNFKLWVESDWSTEVMIVKDGSVDEGRTVVTFRGSEAELDDWMTNADLFMKKSNFTGAPYGLQVHGGFQYAIMKKSKLNVRGNCTAEIQPICSILEEDEGKNNVVARVEQEVISLLGNKSDGEVHVTGHSLGGAMAHYFGVWMAAKYPDIKVKVITSGQPRVGNNLFKWWTENSLKNLAVWRIVYNSDTIARLAPKFTGYRHAGHLYQIDEDDKTTAYYRQVGNDDYDGAPSSWYLRSSLLDHSASGAYLSHFNRNINVDKYWPTSFKTKPKKLPKKCYWWQFWCFLF